MYQTSSALANDALFMAMLFLFAVLSAVVGLALCSTGRIMGIITGLVLAVVPFSYYCFVAINGRVWL